MFLIQFRTEAKIATIKAIREASNTMYGRCYTLKYTKDMVENGLLVDTDKDGMEALRLIALAQKHSDPVHGRGDGTMPPFTMQTVLFTFHISRYSPSCAPVNINCPNFTD